MEAAVFVFGCIVDVLLIAAIESAFGEQWRAFRTNRKFQFHVSTAVIGMLTAGMVLFLWRSTLSRVLHGSLSLEEELILIPMGVTILVLTFILMTFCEFWIFLRRHGRKD